MINLTKMNNFPNTSTFYSKYQEIREYIKKMTNQKSYYIKLLQECLISEWEKELSISSQIYYEEKREKEGKKRKKGINYKNYKTRNKK